MKTNSQTELALDFLQNTKTNIFLTGKAGTGKTTFLRHLKEVSSKRMIVVAPTGVAAINAGGVTIHSFFQLPFGPYIPEQKEGGATDRIFNHKYSRDKINIIRSLDLLVIDEISMVRADLLDEINDVLCKFRDSSQPFGGVQLLLIGDMQQLAPIAKEEEWNILKEYYPSTFFFDSKALKKSNYLCIELTHVYRQDDSMFIRLLNTIREGNFDETTTNLLNQRYIPDFQPEEKDNYITLTTHNYMAQQTNMARLNALPGKTYTFKAEIKNDFPVYAYPTNQLLELKMGAQVMFIKNDTSGQHKYYNGKIGKIVFINDKNIIVTDRQGFEIAVEPETWENIQYTIDPETKELNETISGSFTQYPLKTAWAITIHKSQGLTFEHAIIDAAAAFSHGQVYVALSRCKSLEGLVLNSKITNESLIKDERIASYTSSLTQRQPTEQLLSESQRSYYMEKVSELFDFHLLEHRLQRYTSIVYTHLRSLYPQQTQLLLESRDSFKVEVTNVGERFHHQLTQLITKASDYKENTFIQERICKGADYFMNRIENLLQGATLPFYTDIDNKELRKQLDKLQHAVMEEFVIKRSTLEISLKGFNLVQYLSAKAKASIDIPEKKRKATERKTAQNANTTSSPKTESSSDIKHPKLYEKIRKWRNKLAAEKKVPVYIILQQKAVIGIANNLPQTGKELGNITGIGKKTLELYGEELLQLVKEYTAKEAEANK